MNRNLRVALVGACLALTGTLALAAVPVVVYPDPIQFGTVPLNSTGSPLGIYLTNTTANSINVSNITISGTNSSNFAFYGFPCIGTISGNQTCEMGMTFTPSAMGNLSATLLITVTGVSTPISIPLQGAGGNPIPNIMSLSPPTVYVNSPTTTITINGSGFLSSSVVYLQNSSTPLPTTFVGATQIKTQVPDTVLSATGAVGLYVANPPPGGGTAFTSLQIVAPEPSIGSLSPISIVAGTASEPILVNGQNFMAGAKVRWNGTSIPTTYLSSNQLQAQPTTAQLATASIVQLAVTNPSPGTISSPVTFNVTYPVNLTVLNLPANDLVWDPFAQVIYASVPSSYGSNGNSTAVIKPSTGTITGFFFAGSEPTKLALDGTSKYLYVGLNGSSYIQRFNLPSLTPDIQISLGSTQNAGPNVAAAIAVSPANAHTIAVEITQGGCCSGPLEFFTDSTKLANSVASPQMNQLVFASGTTLYGYVPNSLSQVAVSATGGSLIQQWYGTVTGNSFQYSGGLIFGGNGQEFNPATGLLQGTFDVGSPCCGNGGPQVLPNSAINRAFALGYTPFFNSLGITSYNLTQFTPLGVASLAGLSSSYNSPYTSKFIQWGTNGLAFILTSGCCGNPSSQVVLVQSPSLLLTASKTVKPVPALKSSTPTTVSHGTGNFRLTLRGSGFVPGSVVTWSGKARSASYVSASQMTVYVRADLIASAGTANIAVKNSTPGGGTSNSLTFTIK
jgi:hypothetical protein